MRSKKPVILALSTAVLSLIIFLVTAGSALAELTVSVSPDQGCPGDPITITGWSSEPPFDWSYMPILLVLGQDCEWVFPGKGPPGLHCDFEDYLGTVSSVDIGNNSGNWSLAATVPDVAVGTYNILAIPGPGYFSQATFDVVECSVSDDVYPVLTETAPQTATVDRLPSTGFTVMAAGIAGAGLLAGFIIRLSLRKNIH